MKEHRYYIVFRYQDAQGYVGFGNIEISSYILISDMDVIAEIQSQIKTQTGYHSVLITFWKRFESEDERLNTAAHRWPYT